MTTQHPTEKEVELFWNISQSVVSETHLPEILQLIVTMTANVMGSKICSLMLLNEKRTELQIAATQALGTLYLNKPPVKVGESISGQAVKEKKIFVVKDLQKEKKFMFPDVAKAEGLVSLASVPMIVGNRAIGVINSYTSKPHEFTKTELKILQAMANQAAIAIESASLRKENISFRQAMEDRKLIEQAKGLIMKHDKLDEKQAYGKIQKTSRDHRKSMAEIATAIIMLYSLKEF